ncbi:MAG: multidrug transporter [Gammaproteobacteria bacterium]|nr:multidrug transporter [Gammaproteobacteria bacterium]MBU1979600.1 multidrug transporter [Gammaproteobacteria bacterium]
MAKTTSQTRTIFRSSVSGRIVDEKFARAHPRETEKERVKIPSPKKPQG